MPFQKNNNNDKATVKAKDTNLYQNGLKWSVLGTDLYLGKLT